MTTRRWMVFVAGLAIVLGIYLRLSILRREYKARAMEFRGKAIKSDLDIVNAKNRLIFSRHPGIFAKAGIPVEHPEKQVEIRLEIQRAEKEAEYNKAMQAKYERAALYPWLVVK